VDDLSDAGSIPAASTMQSPFVASITGQPARQR